MDLKTAMMDVRGLESWWERDQEQGVMVDKLITSIDVGEHSDIFLLGSIVNEQDICRHQVEVLCIKRKLLFKIAHD